MLRCRLLALLAATVLSTPCGLTAAHAANFFVTNTNSSGPGSLADAINQSNYASAGPDTITIQDNLGTIQLQDIGGGANFPYVIADDVIINGGVGNTVDGTNVGRVFLVTGQTPGSNINVTISNLTIANGLAQGGAGGLGGGGGGMGAGGAILISEGNVTLENVAFTGNDAIGGNGGVSAIATGGGGGGLGGNGGDGGTSGFPGGGGGGGSIPGADGGGTDNGLPGGDGGSPSGGPGPAGGAYNPGGNGGNGSNAMNSGDGGGGGGGGGSGSGGNGGNGADGGGGGGSGYGTPSGTGGNGGLGGGGGGGSAYNGSGGNGGLGGGGGGGARSPGVAGSGGFGGGNGGAGLPSGAVSAGGGGAGFGGAIFVRQGSNLTLRGNVTFNGGVVTGGTGANAGLASGSGVFLNGSGNLAIDAATGQSQIIGDDIADEAGIVAGGYTAPAGFTPGSWSLTKTGLGTVTLNGVNAFSGPTSVTGGSLIVNGSIGTSSLLTVGSGARVGGTGLLAPTVINVGGTLAPGNGVGTLTVNGNLTFNGGSRYSVDVSPTDADRANVTGVATLTGGVVVLSYAPGTYVTRNYTILNAAGGLGGTRFAGLTAGLLPGLTSSLQYDANNVYLQTASASGGNPVYNGLTDNQQAVANSLLSYFDSTGSLPAEFATLDANGLTRVSGEVATTAISSGLHAADLFIGAISDPFVANSASPVQQASAPMGYALDSAQPSSVRALSALGEETASAAETANRQLSMSGAHAADALAGYASSSWTIWGAAYGGAQDIDGDSAVGSADLTTRNWGIATGFDYGIEDGKIGFALGGGGSSFSLENDLGSGNAAVFNAGIYGSKAFGNAYVAAAAAYAFNSVDTTRAVFGDTLEADYDAHTLSGRVEGGYRFDTSLAAIIPYAAVQGSSYFLPDYSENSVNGGPFALSYDSQTQSALRTELGARIEHIIATDTGSIKLSGRSAWVWNAENARDVTTAFQSLAAPSFTIDGAEPDEHALLVDAGAEFGLSEKLSAKVSFNGQFSGNVTAYGAAAKLSYKW